MQLTYQDLICALYEGNISCFKRERESKLKKLDGALKRAICIQYCDHRTFIYIGSLFDRF